MKLRRIVTAILTAALLFSVPLSVSALYTGYYYRFFFSEDFNGGLSGWYPTVRMSEGFTFGPDGGVVGGPDAKYIISDDACGHDLVYCGCPHNSYVTYDMTVTLFAVDDSARVGDRFINLVYHNYNPVYLGGEDKALMMSFTYDFQNDCFRFTNGLNNTDEEYQLMPPVYMDICDNGMEYYTLGMTVEKNRIRCFYNGTLVFDYKDTEEKYLIAHEIMAPFLLWNEGNFVHVTNITTDRPGYLLEPSYYAGDANGDGKLNLSDVSLIMKHIAKWKGLSINIYAADTSRDGKVTLTDAVRILQMFACAA